jgi:hypothetical protein
MTRLVGVTDVSAEGESGCFRSTGAAALDLCIEGYSFVL